MDPLAGRAAIVGLGATEFSKNSGRSELQLAVEATMSAILDAGLTPMDVDGIVTYAMDHNPEVEVFRNIGGKALRFFSRAPAGGGGACSPILQAAMAVTCRVADVIVCYRAMNERSQYRFGKPVQYSEPTTENVMYYYHHMHGLQTPAAVVGIAMRRYMHRSGATCEDFANVAISARRQAATNPNAFYYRKPLSRDEYMASKMIADPFRLFDCCMESDGAVAVVITSAERARYLRRKPAFIRAGAISAPANMVGMTNYYGKDPGEFEEIDFLARQLYDSARLTPKDIQSAIFYDHFGPTVMPSLEAFGFCKPGEAKDFIKDGNIELTGAIAVNPNGGQIGEAYIHGMNGISEAVRQIRGTAANKVKGVANVVVTGACCFPMSGVILSEE